MTTIEKYIQINIKIKFKLNYFINRKKKIQNLCFSILSCFENNQMKTMFIYKFEF